MEVIGYPALTAAAPHGDVPLAAAVPGGLVPEAVLPLDPVGDGWFTGAVFPSDEFADGGLAYDDDPRFVDADDFFPEDPFSDPLIADDNLPEDPFPEALLYDAVCPDGGSSGSDAPRLSLDHRVESVRTLLRADLTAEGPGLIDQIHAWENIKAMIAGQQARLAVEFEARQRKEQAAFGAGTSPGMARPGTLPAEQPGRKRPQAHNLGVAEQIALARGESPHRGGRLLGMAKALVIEMPHSLGALDTGQLNEERAMYFVKETACLTVEDRTAVDEELAADTGTFTGVGTRGVIAAVKAAATRRDPRSVTSAPATPPRSGR